METLFLAMIGKVWEDYHCLNINGLISLRQINCVLEATCIHYTHVRVNHVAGFYVSCIIRTEKYTHTMKKRSPEVIVDMASGIPTLE